MSEVPATGSRSIVGFAREAAWGVPSASESMVFMRGVQPLSVALQRAEVASGELAESGFVQPGMPGPITGPVDLGFLQTASGSLELLEHVLGCEAAKTTLEATYAYQYDFDPAVDRTETSLRVFTGFPAPGGVNRLARWHFFGMRLTELVHAIGANAPIPTRVKGLVGSATRYDLPEADAGNTGSYVLGPYLRGPVRRQFPAGHNIYVNTERDVAGGGVRLQVQLASALPTSWIGSPQSISYGLVGQAVWQRIHAAVTLSGTVSVTAGMTAVTGVGTLFLVELRVGDYVTIEGATHRVAAIASNTALTLATAHVAGAAAKPIYLKDYGLGYEDVGENWDPVELILPGDVTDHGDIDIGDAWSAAAPGGWADPSPTYLVGQRFTGAHWLAEWAELGSSSWQQLAPQSGNVTLSWPVTADVGTGSRYPHGIDRDGVLAPKLSIPQRWRDMNFEELLEAGERFQLRVTSRGRLLGNPASQNRESIVYTFPRVAITGAGKPVSGPQAIVETLECAPESDPSTGASPVTARVITARDWTAIAA